MKNSRSFTIFTLFLIFGFLGLGLWQLHRKAEKELLIHALVENQKAPPRSVNEVKTPTLFQPLRAQGHFLPGKTVFLSSKTHQGKNGVYVLDVLHTQGGQYLLVQRGWTPTTIVVVPHETLKIEGIARVPTAPTYFQPKNSPPTYFWIDLGALSKELGVPLLPYYLVAKSSFDPQILPTDPIPFPSNNHFYYALTWFLLAFFILCVLLYNKYYSIKKEIT
jgi:surfeit locus 1 family protein